MDYVYKSSSNPLQTKAPQITFIICGAFVLSLHHSLMLFFLTFRQEVAGYHREQFEQQYFLLIFGNQDT